VTWTCLVEYSIQPSERDWSKVADIKKTVTRVLGTLVDYESFQRGSMIASELAENLMKYSDWTQGRSAVFCLETHYSDQKMRLRTANPVKGDDKNVAKLIGIIESIKTLTPEQAFAERLAQLLALEQGPATSPGLGLLRIAHEGRCDIEAMVDSESRLAVVATMQIGF